MLVGHLTPNTGYSDTEYCHVSSSLTYPDFSLPFSLAFFEIYTFMAECVFESIQIYILVLKKFAFLLQHMASLTFKPCN